MTLGTEVVVIYARLGDLDLVDIPTAGGKAARLGHLARAGFRVPDGFVLLVGAEQEAAAKVRLAIRAGLEILGRGPVAVRSSGTQEDLAEASFAGQYESILSVEGEDQVVAAVNACWASAFTDRVGAYAAARTAERGGRMAVLIQRMIQATAAGVAYAANPVTGARDEVCISAVRGLGECLVGGTADPDEWIVRAGDAEHTRGQERALDAQQAAEVADLARRVSAELGAPQDIEWAVDAGGLHLLQARPMTGLSAEVAWVSPVPRAFVRHFRFGEWLGDPVTPLFESWLLGTLEERLHAEFKAIAGVTLPGPSHVIVNGWYFYGLPSMRPLDIFRMLPTVLPKLLVQPRRVAMTLPPTAHFGIELYVREWRELGLPRYLKAVKAAQSEIEDGAAPELIEVIERLATAAGAYFLYITAVAGFAAKAELPLGKFYKEHLHSAIGGSHLVLLQGLVDDVSAQPHAVQSLDWYFPTLGEMNVSLDDGDQDARRAKLSTLRVEAEARARAALAGDPKKAKKFEELLAVAQRFQPLREECVSHLTRGWPVMRRALERLGSELAGRGTIEDAADIHFMTRDEVVAALTDATRRFPVAERRSVWEQQRRLAPPLVIGELSSMARKILEDFSEATRSASSAKGIQGVAASPGRATGPARVIRDASEFDRLLPGEVLVTQATTPAWTPLFSRAAAVVTDTGSIGSHASQVAREYGIPAVVCTGDATRRLRTGQLVSVDGSAGVVERLSSN